MTTGGRASVSTETGPTPFTALVRERNELWLWVRHLERLAEAGLLARGLIHELGNTLTALMAHCELALIDGDPEALRRAATGSLELARTAAERLHTFVRFCCRDEEHPHDVVLAAVVEDALNLLAHPLRKGCVAIERHYDSTVRVRCSRPLLTQVVTNAILFAVRGIPPSGGVLEFHVRRQADEAVLEVKGARRVAAQEDPVRPESEKLDLDAGRQRATGLELLLSRKITAQLGGSLDFSGEEDRASRACLRLPGARRGTPDDSETAPGDG